MTVKSASKMAIGTRRLALVLACTGLLIGCGGEELDDEGLPPTPAWENRAPSLVLASPGSMAVGEWLQIIGKDFIPPAHGYPLLELEGTYFDSRGGATPVDLQYKAKYVDQGRIAWHFFPNIVFDKTGDQLGYFLGHATVVNVGTDGSQKASQGLPLKIDVKPSLILRTARPTTGGCQPVVEKTIEDTPFALTVEAVGLRDGTTSAPLTFNWAFLVDQWDVGLGYSTMDPSSILPQTGAVVVVDSVTSGRSSSISDGGNKNFLFKVGSDIAGDARLKTLRTGKVPSTGNGFVASINVAALDSSGKQASLSIPLDVSRTASMSYDGSSFIAERFPPALVTDCMSGGNIGRRVDYQESESETRARSMSFQYNMSAGVSIGIPLGPTGASLGINFSAGFGVDVGASVTSSQSKGLTLSGQILPGEYGVFYRQTSKVYRVAKLVGRNACGQTADLGTATLTDWIFTPDLATGPTCVPPSKLSAAQKFLE